MDEIRVKMVANGYILEKGFYQNEGRVAQDNIYVFESILALHKWLIKNFIMEGDKTV